MPLSTCLSKYLLGTCQSNCHSNSAIKNNNVFFNMFQVREKKKFEAIFRGNEG
jgi:hypothetical protein